MNVFRTKVFAREVKKLPRHFREILPELFDFLKNYTPKKSDSIGRKCFKIRFSPTNFQKGKSGSLRVIIFFIEIKNTIIPISIFSKSEKENLSEKELETLLHAAILEMKNR